MSDVITFWETGWGRFDEMETIAAAAAATAANVMRMRRGKKQYRRVCRGMESLPVELAEAAGGRGGGWDDGEERLQRGNEDEGAWWRKQGEDAFGFFRAARARTIDHYTLRPSLKAPD